MKTWTSAGVDGRSLGQRFAEWFMHLSGWRLGVFCGAWAVLFIALIIGGVYGLLTYLDSTWSCPPGAPTVYDVDGFRVGCVGVAP